MFKSMILIDLFTPNGLKGMKIIGDLEFNQKCSIFQG